ncbi:secondary thiamine-phosphate synthase enzyme YjbQ [Pleionea mediterranea]|uniref:Secondary thiamine-phosphate synthase enzyme n=1 Tax=Pleionea mediterranea TaxID=523701 RepID=A0A316FEE8_9GAMM|nr:secondary thiamine-phosphate synthase enzyme YjbQ [Pleionea mediterranea]PWK47258.1 secondary thiamine-phosphate synthase enzyme [Pleionea mediterranea]
MIGELSIRTDGQGMTEFTQQVQNWLLEQSQEEGLCTLFVQHTSCSLVIQENADPSAQRDLEQWMNRLVPENDPLYTHTYEGPDDMPAHIKAALTATSIAIPVCNKQLMLGIWQGVFLWEHRHQPGMRRIILHLSQ